jgi:hypothetical protein
MEALDHDVGYFTYMTSKALRMILMPVTERIPAANYRRRSLTEYTTEPPRMTYESVRLYRCTSNIKSTRVVETQKNIE